MLDFAHRPPRGPEDVTLSETGEYVLREIPADLEIAHAVGMSVCSELIDAFEESERDNLDPLPYLTGITDKAELWLSGDISAFNKGINEVRMTLTTNQVTIV